MTPRRPLTSEQKAKYRPTVAKYGKEFYEAHKIEILAKQRRRYAEDKEYREGRLARAKAIRLESPGKERDTKRVYTITHRAEIKEAGAKWREANPERDAQNRKNYAALHPDRLHATSVRWRKLNPEKIRNSKIAYREENIEKIRISRALYRELNAEKLRADGIAYVEANREKVNALRAKRRSAKIQRIPLWFDKEAADAVYTQAALLRSLGIDCHVDHIIPLRGKNVSGLHIHTNLQVITARENAMKGNKFEVMTA